MKHSLNKIFNGLSAQHAGDYLTTFDKQRVLSNKPIQERFITRVNSDKSHPSDAQSLSKQKHIAILCNDTTSESVLTYVLDNAKGCSIDVLFHGAHTKTQDESFYKQARSSFNDNNIDVRLVKLINDSVNEVKNYLMNHRSLQYLVTDSHNLLITEFLSNKKNQKQVDVPIVLIR